MKLFFNLAFDGEPWPGPLGVGEPQTRNARMSRGRKGTRAPQPALGPAAIGEAWVGRRGLLGVLETQLGLPDLSVGAGERDAALVPAVRATPGFWSQSAVVDPLGVATELRSWRDHLVLHGWEPERVVAEASVGPSAEAKSKPGKGRKASKQAEASVEDRLLELARLTAGLLPGFVDRVRAVRDELRAELEDPGSGEHGRLEIDELVLHGQPREALSLLWRQIVEAVGRLGIPVTEVVVPTPERKVSDLTGALEQGFAPRGDGSLQLVRPVGPQAAAECVAAWLAERAEAGDLDGTVIIGGDALLDASLRQQGLPTTGAPSSADGDPLGAVLPLVIQLGWGPVDPQVALDLLLLPTSPVPRGLARRLTDALAQWPAVGSPDWDEAIETWLGEQEEDYQKRVAARLERLFQVDAPGETYPAEAVVERARLLEEWARGRQLGERRDQERTLSAGRDGEREGEREGAGQPETAVETDEDIAAGWRWDQVIGQCVSLRAMAATLGIDPLSRAQLGALLGEVGASTGGGETLPAEVGLVRLRDPAQLAGPARRVIWWGFQRDAVGQPFTLPLTDDEARQLEADSARLPDAGLEARFAREIWKRPFALATESLLLVCPRLGEDGEPAFPHPIWDEVVAGLTDAAQAILEAEVPRGLERRRRLKPLSLPASAAIWEVEDPSSLPWPEDFSPSRIGIILGCPVRYALEKDLRLEARLPVALCDTSDDLLLGNLSHHVLERLLEPFIGRPLPSAEEAETLASSIVDETLDRCVTMFSLPGSESARATLRQQLVGAASALVTALGPGRAVVAGVEQSLSRATKTRALSGRADLVLSRPSAVVDFKYWGKGTRQAQLRSGTAHQLAVYAWALGKGRGPLPATAYFFVYQGQLLTTSPGVFPVAEVVDGPDLEITLGALDSALAEVRAARADGSLACGGTPDEEVPLDKAAIDEEGVLRLPPGCKYCDYGALCQVGGVR